MALVLHSLHCHVNGTVFGTRTQLLLAKSRQVFAGSKSPSSPLTIHSMVCSLFKVSLFSAKVASCLVSLLTGPLSAPKMHP